MCFCRFCLAKQNIVTAGMRLARWCLMATLAVTFAPRPRVQCFSRWRGCTAGRMGGGGRHPAESAC